MDIAANADQLRWLSTRIPDTAVHQIRDELHALRRDAAQTQGDTARAQQIENLAATVTSTLDDTITALQRWRDALSDHTDHHQRGLP
ncbi:hypothetical protein [Actinokineospora diospyrosa]|uniref:Uncharacterized protein n=1 Tax=Actinokineospora diospyrosa TaxID=103728 RepID=A0ABT1IDY6_9PSEU|nr:hypothetical protein [Actinokineospora diospyrosa]MCP2270857.1 hypothetical protein [Actinokineospora diospyrosa]